MYESTNNSKTAAGANPTKHLNSVIDPIKSKVESGARDAVDWIEAEMGDVAKYGAKSLHEAKEMTASAFEELSTQLSAAMRKGTQFVRANPMISLAAVVVIGYGITRFARSKGSYAALQRS